jgi:uncharacterized protein (DUF779 family)
MRIGERGLFTIAFPSLCDNETITFDTAPSVETVQYDIELLSTIQDLHGDGGIIMKLTFGGCDWSLSSWDCQPRESDYVTGMCSTLFLLLECYYFSRSSFRML